MDIKKARERFEPMTKKGWNLLRKRDFTKPKKSKWVGLVEPRTITEFLESVPHEPSTPEEAIIKLASHMLTDYAWHNPIDKNKPFDYWVKDKRGNCHVQSTLLVYSLRKLGIPAEVQYDRSTLNHTLVIAHLPEELLINFDLNQVNFGTKKHWWTLRNVDMFLEDRRKFEFAPGKSYFNLVTGKNILKKTFTTKMDKALHTFFKQNFKDLGGEEV